jgi:hypothetical protein
MTKIWVRALERIDQLGLELCITLLNHKVGDGEYKSVIVKWFGSDWCT